MVRERLEERRKRETLAIEHAKNQHIEPFKKARHDVEQLRQELERYNWEKEELRNTKARLLVIEDEFRNLRWEDEVLQQRFGEVRSQRDELYERFQATVYEVQQKSGFRNLLLERKLESLAEVLEQKEAQLDEVLARANLEPSVMGQMRGRVEDVLQQKQHEAADLQSELERVTAVHKQLVGAIHSKMLELGVPTQELGFQAIKNRVPNIAPQAE